jgi:hypothetical protein
MTQLNIDKLSLLLIIIIIIIIIIPLALQPTVGFDLYYWSLIP